MNLFSPILSLLFFLTSIHSYQFSTINGGTVDLSQHTNKKILLVNIASSSADAGQLQQLEQLYQQYHDSVLIIAIPSNSFGNEPKDSAALTSWLYDSLQVSFPVAMLSAVTGGNKHPLYDWLGDANKNGIANITIKKDFQKYLINKNGELIGFFESHVQPNSTSIQNALQSSSY